MIHYLGFSVKAGCVKTSPLFDQLNSNSWMLEELGRSGTLETIRKSTNDWNPNPAELELIANSLFMLSTHRPDEVLNKEDVDNFNAVLHQVIFFIINSAIDLLTVSTYRIIDQ